MFFCSSSIFTFLYFLFALLPFANPDASQRMTYQINKDTTTMSDTTPSGARFDLTVKYTAGDNVETLRLYYPDTKTGMQMRTKHVGELFFRLTRGIDIPRNWYAHNEA